VSDANVRDASDLPGFGDAPVLAAIPQISNTSDRRRRRLVFVFMGRRVYSGPVHCRHRVISALK